MKNLMGLLAIASFAFINTAQAEGNIENGRALSASCSACHGTGGMSPSEQWPNIAGQKESYLVTQLTKYKSGDRKDPTMSAIVGPLTAENINDLAAYFASNSAVASFSFQTQMLSIPYVKVGDAMFDVEMSLDSIDELIFSVDSIEEH